MARDANGNYTLPAGNPVAAGTVISTTWANPTLTDIAQALTDSLSRNGDGGMLVAFENVDGNVALPGITWTLEPSTGLYREATNDMQASVAGSRVTRWFNDTATPNGEQNPFQIWDGLVWRDVLRNNYFDPITFRGLVTMSGGAVISGGASTSILKVSATGGDDALSFTALAAGSGGIMAALDDALNDYEPLRVIGESIQLEYRTGAGTSASGLTIASTGAATFSGNLGLPLGAIIDFSGRGNITHDASTFDIAFNTNSLANAFVVKGTGDATFNGSVTVPSGATGKIVGADNTSYWLLQAAAAGGASIYLNGGTRVGFESHMQMGAGKYVWRNIAHTVDHMTLDASGNLGIGKTPLGNNLSPTLEMVSGGTMFGYGDAMYLTGNLYYNGGWKAIATGAGASMILDASGPKFYTNASASAGAAVTPVERMRLDANGNLLVGTTTIHGLSGAGAGTFVTGLSDGQLFLRHSGTTAGYGWYLGADASSVMQVYNQSGVGVTMANGATAWSATSDERLKDIIEPITDGLAKVRRLRSVVGKYKSDDVGVRRAFLIAQDVLAEQPEAVDQTNPDALALRSTEVIPLLVSALHDASDMIEALTARIEALEGA